MLQLSINRRKYVWFLVGLVVMFVLLQIYNMYQYMVDIQTLGIGKAKFIRMIDLDKEANLPSTFSTVNLLTASVLLFVISRIEKAKRFNWVCLSAIFLFLGFDESALIHENIGSWSKSFIPDTMRVGALYAAWLIPYLVLMVLFIVSFFKFVISLEWKYFRGFCVAGAIFVMGAVGMEMFASIESYETGTTRTFKYCLLYTVEEFLEMIGIVIFINYLLMYIQEKTKKGKIEIEFK